MLFAQTPGKPSLSTPAGFICRNTGIFSRVAAKGLLSPFISPGPPHRGLCKERPFLCQGRVPVRSVSVCDAALLSKLPHSRVLSSENSCRETKDVGRCVLCVPQSLSVLTLESGVG